MARGRTQKSIVSFNAGELSPLLDARVDIDKYSNGCRQLQNAVVETYGAVRRRPGLEFIAPAKFHDAPPRLLTFRFSTTTTYILEMGAGYIRYYADGAPVVGATPFATFTSYVVGNRISITTGGVFGVPVVITYYVCLISHTSGSFATDLAAGKWLLLADPAYEIVSPYSAADVFNVQAAQLNDVIFLAHPNYPVYKLSRISEINWTLLPAEFDVAPLLDENLTATTISSSGTTGSVTLTASAALFQAGHVGSYWQISHLRQAASAERNIEDAGAWVTAKVYAVTDTVTQAGNRYRCLVAHTAGTFSTELAANKWVLTTMYQITVPLRILGEWNLRTYGTWQATIYLERSINSGTTWERIRKFSGKEDRNIDVSGKQDSEALLRAVVEDWVVENPASGTTPRVVLEAVDAYIYGLVKITAVASTTSATATVINDLESTAATKTWSEGAWSGVRGYPRTVTFYEQRLCFAGSEYQPQTVWGSVINDYQNFKVGTEDTDAFFYTIAATERNAIQWMANQKGLLIGTSGGEWSMQAGAQDQPITPTNVLVRRQSNYGSYARPANIVNDVALFIQRNGRRVREMTYAFEKDGYVAPDLTLLAEHITVGGVLQTAYAQQPQSVLWCITGGGTLVGMTYERDQSVVGWHRHVTDGLFESVATIYGASDDEVWVVVKRVINGVTKRYIERFNPFQWVDKEDAFYVDSGLSYDGAPATTFSGLGHLEGKTVSILADGAPHPTRVVTAGAVTLDDTASVVQIGLPFTTIVEPMRLDSDSTAGVSQGNVKQIRELVVRLNKSLGLSYGDGIKTYNLSFRDTSMPMDASPPLYTGDKVIEFDGDFELDARLIIKQEQPLPLCLLAIVVKYEITGN